MLDGNVVLWGLMNCHRDENVNALVPVGKSYPPDLTANDLASVKQTLQEIVSKLQIRCGAMNVELIVDQDGRVFPIDIGPRNGGNMIPVLLEYIWGVDIVELTIKAAMGEPVSLAGGEGIPYYATHNLHCDRSGIFENIEFSQALTPYIVRKHIYKKPGDSVEYFDNAEKALGIVFLRFHNPQEMHEILSQINDHIHVVLKGD